MLILKGKFILSVTPASHRLTPFFLANRPLLSCKFPLSFTIIISYPFVLVNKKAPCRVLFYISSFGGTSMLSETYFPFFLRCFTHSVSRYSICPFTERKSSSAQEAMSLYSFSERRKGICFFSAISVQTTRIYHGLCVAVTAENNQEI